MLEETDQDEIHAHCVICDKNSTFASSNKPMCLLCEEDFGKNYIEIDKTETHEERDRKGGWKQNKYTIKIRKRRRRENYKLARALQEIDILKKEQNNLQCRLDFCLNEIKRMKMEYLKRSILGTSNESVREEPLSTSTPTYSKSLIKGRNTYQNRDKGISPILAAPPDSPHKCNSKSQDATTEESMSESDSEVQDNTNHIPQERYHIPERDIIRKPLAYNKSLAYNKPHKFQNEDSEENKKKFFVATIIVIISLITYISFSPSDAYQDPEIRIEIEDLKHNFPHQAADMWSAIQSGISEVKQMNKPSVFLFVYDDRMQHFLQAFVSNITGFASCILNDNCSVHPVELMGKKLTGLKTVDDYGYLIEKFRPEVEKKRVMVIYNLEEIPGELAQAFHSFCDEYNPLVGKSVYFFIMKLDDSEQGDTATVEGILRRKWSDLKEDIFDPLFTRISSMVIPLQPENNSKVHM